MLVSMCEAVEGFIQRLMLRTLLSFADEDNEKDGCRGGNQPDNDE
jgi:hypothetical protein